MVANTCGECLECCGSIPLPSRRRILCVCPVPTSPTPGFYRRGNRGRNATVALIALLVVSRARHDALARNEPAPAARRRRLRKADEAPLEHEMPGNTRPCLRFVALGVQKNQDGRVRLPCAREYWSETLETIVTCKLGDRGAGVDAYGACR